MLMKMNNMNKIKKHTLIISFIEVQYFKRFIIVIWRQFVNKMELSFLGCIRMQYEKSKFIQQDAHGPHRSTEKPLQFIYIFVQSYDLIICHWFGEEKSNYLQFEYSSPKDALCQVWLKLTQWFWWFWWRRFLDFVNVFTLICANLPL